MPGQSLIEILFKTKYDGGGANNASSELKQISGTAGLAEGALTAMAGAAAIAAAVKFGQMAFELAEVGAQSQRVENSFRQMQASAGQSAEGTLQALRKASQGAIADTQLELNANRAKVLGVAQTSEQLAQLLEAAAARGKAVGRSTAEAFDDIVTGIGRMSPLILDNLGIMTGGAATFNEYAASIGKAGDQLTDAEKKQALFNKVIADSRGMVEANKSAGADMATSFERMDASIQNAKTALGELFGPAVAVVAQKIADAAMAAADGVKAVGGAMNQTSAINAMQEQQKAIEGTNRLLADQKALLATLTPGTEAYRNVEQGIMSTMGDLHNEQDALNKARFAYLGVLNQLYPTENANADALNKTSIVAEGAARTQAVINDQYQRGIGVTDAMRASVVTLAGALPALSQGLRDLADSQTGAIESIAAANVKFIGAKAALEFVANSKDALKEQVKDWKDSGYTIDQIQGVLLPAYVSNLRDANNMTAQAKAATSAYKSEVKQINAEYEKLKGKVAGVIEGAQSLSDIGVDPSKILRKPGDDKSGFLLPREDEINENARRLADIAVNGFKGQDWLGKFKAEVPDIWKALEESGDPRATAARLLQRFQDGLEPELLDKEKAKERVRKLLLGEEKTSELVDEITKELADEMGTATPSDLKSKVKEALTGQGDEKTKIEVDTSGIAPAIQTAFAAPDISVSGGGSGDAAGKAFNDKMLAAVAETGNKLIDAVDGELRAPASLERLGTAGNMGGTAYGTQFLNGAINNIAQPFLDAVTGIVTSNVIAKLNTQNQLQGANP